MSAHVRLSSSEEVFTHVRRLLDAGRPHDAAELIRRSGFDSEDLSNALAVCLLRSGDHQRALDILRRLTLQPGGVCLKLEAPLHYKLNLAVGLIVSGNVAGGITLLQELHRDDDTEVAALVAAIRRWRSTLSWTQRCLLSLAGVAPRNRPVQFDGPPGVLVEHAAKRPAA